MIKVEVDFGNDGFKVDAMLYLKGNKWWVSIGDNLQESIHGFSENPLQAINNFKSEFRNNNRSIK